MRFASTCHVAPIIPAEFVHRSCPSIRTVLNPLLHRSFSIILVRPSVPHYTHYSIPVIPSFRSVHPYRITPIILFLLFPHSGPSVHPFTALHPLFHPMGRSFPGHSRALESRVSLHWALEGRLTPPRSRGQAGPSHKCPPS